MAQGKRLFTLKIESFCGYRVNVSHSCELNRWNMTNEKNSEIPHDTEDKSWWLQHGENLELEFVAKCQNLLGLEIIINPIKQQDKTAPDLLFQGQIADLKTQNTPFFSASRYRIDPRFCVTFNRKDFERYEAFYPEIIIFFWVDWKQLSYKEFSIDHLAGIYRIEFKQLREIVRKGAPEHTYLRRKDDTLGNAKSSFLFDVREMTNLTQKV